ncbi:MAG: DrmB family protein [Candidatus Muiribacteriota bacterium]
MSERGPVRQAQVITPFGPGSIHTDRYRVSLICCGLDYWFKGLPDDVEEYRIKDEWRLNRYLQVKELRLPPDYRRRNQGIKPSNPGKTIPFLRFPTWHYCIGCGKMKKTSMTYQGRSNELECPDCGEKKMVQVRFISVCEEGHIMEFPWNEWAHQLMKPSCNGDDLYLYETSGNTLGSIFVKCKKCNSKHSLEGITYGNLSIKSDKFKCQGVQIWNSDDKGSGCGNNIRGALRNASNIYFPKVFSSIFIPKLLKESKKTDPLLSELIVRFEKPSISETIELLIDIFSDESSEMKTKKILKALKKDELGFSYYEDDLLCRGIAEYFKLLGEKEGKTEKESCFDETDFRLEEYKSICQEWDLPELKSKKADLKKYSLKVQDYFSNIMLIEKLRETRAFLGFSRLAPPVDFEIDEDKLWLNPPDKENLWLPGVKVYGEGLFFEFRKEKIKDWISGSGKSEIAKRLKILNKNSEKLRCYEQENKIHPVMVMIHTFSHLLMNQLTYQCGYSSAALRERLYFSFDKDNFVAGLLIYTASGDSEGTFGGLVRMGKTELFEPLLKKTMENAYWCSADPVCMEMGKSGQGPESCNLAACHNCALVPETACEMRNRFLDRGLVTGTFENTETGFFNKFLE